MKNIKQLYKEYKNSIHWYGKIEIGNIKQWILVRGKNKDNPIILFLHGGPGISYTPFITEFQKELEDYFIVVNWDQRGAGKSFESKENIKGTMTINQFVIDTYELIKRLQKRFGKKKIYLVGHSWGSAIGLIVAKKYPELLFAFIGVGQVVNYKEEDRISYEYILEMAKKSKKKRIITKIEKIGYPPYIKNSSKKIHQKWLMKFDGKEKGINLKCLLIKGIIEHPLYTLIDGVYYIFGKNFTEKEMQKELENINFFDTIEELNVPLYICAGKFDYITPTSLSKKYFDKLKCDKKEFIYFDKSAHFPLFREYKKFNEILIKIVEGLL